MTGYLTWAFLNRQSLGGGGGGGSPHDNFVVIAPMIMKFGTGINVFYIKKACDELPNPFTDLAEIWYSEVFWECLFQISSQILLFENFKNVVIRKHMER